MFLIVLVEQMQDDAVDERSCGILPERIFASTFSRLDHHLGNRRNIGKFLKRLEVDFSKGVPLGSRSILAEGFELHDALVQMMLAPTGREIPELALRIEKENAVLPADSCRHHVADTFAAPRWRDEQDVLRPIVEHELVIEWIASDDKAGLFR